MPSLLLGVVRAHRSSLSCKLPNSANPPQDVAGDALPLPTSFSTGRYTSCTYWLPSFNRSFSLPAFFKRGTPGNEGCSRWPSASSCITKGAAEILTETFKEEEEESWADAENRGLPAGRSFCNCQLTQLILHPAGQTCSL